MKSTTRVLLSIAIGLVTCQTAYAQGWWGAAISGGLQGYAKGVEQNMPIQQEMLRQQMEMDQQLARQKQQDQIEGERRFQEKLLEMKQKAEAGDATAQNDLGVMYYRGKGVPKDAAKAVEWYQKAVAQGNSPAQFNLGVMYHSGEGVPKDAAKAVEWYQKAATQGNAFAQGNLGVMYARGEGVPEDELRAYIWSNLAAAQGNETAKKNRDIYEAQMTPDQRAEGQRLSSNWKKGDTMLSSEQPKNNAGNPPNQQNVGLPAVKRLVRVGQVNTIKPQDGYLVIALDTLNGSDHIKEVIIVKNGIEIHGMADKRFGSNISVTLIEADLRRVENSDVVFVYR